MIKLNGMIEPVNTARRTEMIDGKRRIKPANIPDVIIIAVLALVAITCITPVINVVAMSFSSKVAAESGSVFLWPVQFSTSSYAKLMQDGAFFTAFGVSVKRVLLGGAINFTLTVLMAYPLSRNTRQFKSRNAYMWILVFTLLFNGGLIPWYMTVKTVGILNTIWALVLPGAVPVFSVILLMNFFRGIPHELEEAAIIDGAGPWSMLIKLFLPISLPALATIILLSVVSHWNSFFDGLILINDNSRYPLQTYIQTLTVPMDTTSLSTMTPQEIAQYLKVSNLTLNSAKIVLSMIPILLVYPFLQRYFVTGIVMGSVKE